MTLVHLVTPGRKVAPLLHRLMSFNISILRWKQNRMEKGFSKLLPEG